MNTQRHSALIAAGVFGFLGVAFGAFGAHALKNHLSDAALSWWQTAVEYQLFHAAVLLALAWAPDRHRVATWAFGIGITLFSGSLYTMALTNLTGLGMVTPIGGVAFLVGWACLIITGLAKNQAKK
jgi:uncharacterized membrane protein YgdD (TMEM256/DUF423 family)